jgi:type IV pilus assembly protein PilO
MNLSMEELRRLDPKDIGNWPAAFQLIVLGLITVVIVVLGYFLVLDGQRAELATGQAKEEELKQAFLDKKSKAISLEAYKEQLVDIQQSFGALLKQLPNKAEMETLITEINQSGVGRGLRVLDFKPDQSETKTTEFAERPIAITLAGSYHDLAAFASDIAQLSRIVTLSNMHLSTNGSNVNSAGMLQLEVTAKTYRALDSEEAVAQKKGAKGQDKH